MYTPPSFALSDETLIREIVADYGFATLVTQNDRGLEAAHIPLLWAPRGLVGHLARANRFFEEGLAALAIFSGPHAYVLPTWYDSTPAVPTWNYLAVHVSGTLHEETPEDTELQLSELVKRYEPNAAAYAFAALPAEYRNRMQRGIRAFRLAITRVEAKAKLSQNHSPERIRRVIERLEASTDQNARDLARYMRRLSLSSRDA